MSRDPDYRRACWMRLLWLVIVALVAAVALVAVLPGVGPWRLLLVVGLGWVVFSGSVLVVDTVGRLRRR